MGILSGAGSKEIIKGSREQLKIVKWTNEQEKEVKLKGSREQGKMKKRATGKK